MKFSDIILAFKGITVFALVGPSGTGKSFRAKLVAEKYGIDAIIDDGLLIQNDKIVAGQTAKREKTYMGAVRVALFDDKGHRDQVAKALQKNHIKKILLLGTSEKMVQKIAIRLQLPAPSKIIDITDVASQEDIEIAQRSRLVEGKHVIPVPSIEIKRDYVVADEFDTGLRRKLNLGHTVGHAIENRSSYGISHGRAVAMGMAIVARACYKQGICSENCVQDIMRGLEALRLPTESSYTSDELITPMLSDKKRTGATISLIVPNRIGDCDILPIPVEELENFVKSGL